MAQRGVLDIRTTDLNENPSVALRGEWQFFWRDLILPNETSRQTPKLVTVPHIWNTDPTLQTQGFATYQLKVLLPENRPSLGLTIPYTYTAYTLYINGIVVSKNGTAGKTKNTTDPKWQPKTISLDRFHDTQQLNIVLHISNFDHNKGGISLPIYIGSYDYLDFEREQKLGYAFILAGSLLMGALFFMGLFYFGRPEKSIFYFSLFCIAYSFRVISTDPYPILLIIQNLNWDFLVHIEYISMYISVGLFGKYLSHLYPSDVSSFFVKSFGLIFLLFVITALVFPPLIFTSLVDLFLVCTSIFLAYSIAVIILAWRRKRVGSKYAMISLLILIVIYLWDVLEYYRIVDANQVISFLGYVLFFFFQSLTLSNRFAHHFNLAREKAELANTAKTHFLSTMGHELRTPLNAVIGLSELLVDSKSEDEKTQFAQTIKKSGENLLGIINNILDFTKIESDEVEFKYEPTHIPTLLADTVRMLGSLTDPHKVTLSFRFDDSLSDYIEVDPSRLQQILINLMGNAIKFTDEGEISVHVTSTASIAEKGQLLFIVKDSGIGIPEEKMDLLFDRFSQLHNERNRRYGGTGLGLAISKRLIESMGGRIWVQSNPGEGTTFYFTIINRTVSEEHLQKSKNKQTQVHLPSIKKLHLLVVEDNHINQKVITKVLERLGHSCDIANNGFEALECLENNSYDIIFMDMEMPEMDGIEATIRIHKLPNLTQVPTIIAMTANASTEDKTKCFEAGMKDFISKPITLQTTGNVINKWIT